MALSFPFSCAEASLLTCFAFPVCLPVCLFFCLLACWLASHAGSTPEDSNTRGEKIKVKIKNEIKIKNKITHQGAISIAYGNNNNSPPDTSSSRPSSHFSPQPTQVGSHWSASVPWAVEEQCVLSSNESRQRLSQPSHSRSRGWGGRTRDGRFFLTIVPRIFQLSSLSAGNPMQHNHLSITATK